MPAGVNVLVEDGLASIEFADRSLRGPGVDALLKAAESLGFGPGVVEKFTQPRISYRVPVRVAQAAGLVDAPRVTPHAAPPTPAPAVAPARQGYDDGFPDMDWSRRAINEYAATKLDPPLDVTGEPNKPAALAAIKAHLGL